MLPKYTVGDVITVKNKKEEIVLYNGLYTGTLTFTISFSGASSLLMGSISLALATIFIAL